MGRTRKPFETWRKVMLSGALLLFAVALVQALRKENDGLQYVIATYVGYGLLIVGFSLAMRQRRERQTKMQPDTSEKEALQEEVVRPEGP